MQIRWGVAPTAPVQGKTSIVAARPRRKGGVVTDDAQWFAGIDWASQAHRVCLVDAGGKIVGERAFAHGGAGLAELCAWLLTITGAAPTGIASAIVSRWPGPRTTAAMLMFSATACAPTGTASGCCRTRMRWSSNCASGRV